MSSLRRLITRPVLARSGLSSLKNPNLGNGVKGYSKPFSSTAIWQSQRTKFINALVAENGPGTSTLYPRYKTDVGVDYKSIELDTALLLETLRNMKSYRNLTPNDSSMSSSRLTSNIPLLECRRG
jgi:hypothetical protein